MYLSRVKIDQQNREKMRELSHLGAFHNWVESSFPEEFNRNTRSRKLWRVDSFQGNKYLLIVSENKPDNECLEKYGVPGSAETKSYDHFLEMIEEGCCYKFRVTLNPVKSLARGEERRGRVVPQITSEQMMNYFTSRAESLGFEILPNNCQIVESGWKPLEKKGQKMLFLRSATYEGELRVINKKVFCDTLVKGVGKKKAYGFGLLTVIPVR